MNFYLLKVNQQFYKKMKKQSINWITEKEAAEMLQLSEKYLRRMVTAGNLKGIINYSRLHRYAVVYSKTDIENYIYENSTLIA